MSISCADYDYLEIACLYHYQLELRLVDGTRHIGEAVDLSIDRGQLPEQHEVLSLRNSDGLTVVATSSIKSMQALSENAQFDEVHFR